MNYILQNSKTVKCKLTADQNEIESQALSDINYQPHER